MKKFILAAIIMSFSALALADDKDKDVSEHKHHRIKELDEQIAELQTAKACISSATDHQAMKACHEQLEKARKSHRSQELDEKIHRLQEEKSKINKGDPS